MDSPGPYRISLACVIHLRTPGGLVRALAGQCPGVQPQESGSLWLEGPMGPLRDAKARPMLVTKGCLCSVTL